MLTNYHSHCFYCDGSNPMEDYIVEAIKLKMDGYGFSSHCPVPFVSPWSMKEENLEMYLKTIDNLKEKYKNQIAIFKSFEIDYLPGIVGPKSDFFKSLNLDYTIGSVHYLNNKIDDTFFCIDGEVQAFKEGLNTFYNGDIRALVTAYFESIRQMVSEETPDIVGHLDKIKMHNVHFPFFNEKEGWYQLEVEKTLQSIKKSNAIIEVNTRGLYKKNLGVLYPSKTILERIFELDIPILINSDAHHPSELTKGYDLALQTIKEIGFTTMKYFDGEKFSDFEI